MSVYGEHNGVKFRVNATGQLSIDQIELIKKMVELAYKIKLKPNNDNNRQTNQKDQTTS